MVDRSLGHYEVLARLGAGGMGEVYRARDSRLHREVAIKVLPPRLLGDEAHRTRFEREARLLAALNHPHIASIHGLEQENGEHFLVMEFVDGSDLGARLEQGPLPVEEVLRVARQVAEGLDHAHRQGIIHRDLKPANIALTAARSVKVLDFGLAKALDPGESPDSPSASQSPTILGGATASNVILGTAAYMSPEQARGAAVDHRTDVWAFGCVIYECLCGRRAFEGATISDTLAAVLRDRIDLDQLPPRTPPSLRRLLQRCLERDPDLRLHSLADAKIDLADAERELAEGIVAGATGPVAGGGRSRRVGWGLAAVLAIAWVVTHFSSGGGEPVPRQLVRFSINPDSLDLTQASLPAVSRDGRRIVYAAAGQLWVRSLDRLEAVALPGTERPYAAFWSPDGRQIGFQRARQLLRVGLDGARPVVICETDQQAGGAAGGVWGEDDLIRFCSGDGPVYEVPATGGTPTVFVPIDPSRDDDFHTPGALPGDHGLLFVQHALVGGSMRLELQQEGQRRTLWELSGSGSLSSPVYSPTGHILFHSDGQSGGIWALPFSLAELRATGAPFPVVAVGAHPQVSDDGTLVYLREGVAGAHRIVQIDRQGRLVDLSLVSGVHLDDAAFSPGGDRLIVAVDDGGQVSVFAHDLVRGSRRLVTAGAGVRNPFWVNDDAIGVLRTDSTLIQVHQLELATAPRTIFRGAPRQALARQDTGPSLGNGFVVFTLNPGTSNTDVWIVPLDDPDGGRPLLAGPARERDPQVSPDGTLLVWTSEESGRLEVYLGELQADGSLGPRRWQVSTLGGTTPRWSRDGARLYYATDDLMEVDLQREGGIRLGRPRTVADLSALGIEPGHGYSIAPGDSLLVATQVGRTEGPGREIVVVQNWFEEFRGR